MVQRNKRGIASGQPLSSPAGGASGPILDPTNVKQSALVQRLQHPDPEERMPPDGSSKWTSSMKDQVVEWFGEHHKELMDREDSPSILGCAPLVAPAA